MDGTVLEKARLFFTLEHKVRVSIICLLLFRLMFLLCVNFLLMYFLSSMYSVVYISLWFDHRRTVPFFSLMHYVHICIDALSMFAFLINFCNLIYLGSNRLR